MTFWLIEAAYLAASALFVMSLYWMNDPRTARRGVGAGVVAMVVAVLGLAVNAKPYPDLVWWPFALAAAAYLLGYALYALLFPAYLLVVMGTPGRRVAIAEQYFVSDSSIACATRSGTRL